MEAAPQLQKTFCDLSRADLVLLVRAQGRLLVMRQRARVRRDRRSEANLKLLQKALENNR